MIIKSMVFLSFSPSFAAAWMNLGIVQATLNKTEVHIHMYVRSYSMYYHIHSSTTIYLMYQELTKLKCIIIIIIIINYSDAYSVLY